MRHWQFLLLVLTTFQISYSQEVTHTKTLVPNFGIDLDNKIIVWNTSKDSLANKFELDGALFSLVPIAKELSNTIPRLAINRKDTFQLYITSLPILHISSANTIVNEPKIAAQFMYFDSSQTVNEAMGIELRGNSALKYPKKSYDIEIWSDPAIKESKDVSFGKLRDDDDWILNSLYNEPLKLRSYVSNKLWLRMGNTHKDSNTEKRLGIDLIFTEVFLNSQYQGIYFLSEPVDRKLLKLEKFENGVVNGELFKAGSYAAATSFKKAEPFNNAFPHWGGFEMEYPYEDYNAHWNELYKFVDFVATSTDQDFQSQIETFLDTDNAIDYFLFINLLRGTDNMGKNYFLAKQSASSPYYFVPWDLDGVLGTIQDGKRIATTNDILSNGLFDRLWATNPKNYRKRLKKRWQKLRNKQFDTKNLIEHIDETYNFFTTNGIYERDAAIWPATTTKADDYQYLETWLLARLAFLDNHFKGL